VAFVLLTAACRASDRSSPPTPSRALVVPGDGYHTILDNGLTLFVAPDEHTGAVQLDVRHAVGDRDDPEGKAQLAHLVEHLMFELLTEGPGSRTLGDEANETSLLVNAYTSADETHYMYSGTSPQLEMYFRHAARRLEFDCDELEDATFVRVREVVLNELRWRSRGVDARVRDRVVAEVFPEGHPYRTRQGDREAQLVALTRQDACDFIERHYTPSRTMVVVTGDVDMEQIVALTNARLSGIAPREAPPRAPVPPLQPREDRVVIEAPITTPSVSLLFPFPPRFDEDHAAASAAVLAVAVALVVGKLLPDSAIGGWNFSRLGGKEAPVLAFEVWARTPGQLDEALEQASDYIYEVFAIELPKRTYERVRQARRTEVVQSVARIETRAIAYADYLEQGPDTGFVAAELAAIDDLTAEQIRRVGRRVFSPDHAMVLEFVPEGDPSDAEAERVQLEDSSPPEPFDHRERSRSDVEPVDVALPSLDEGRDPRVRIEQLELSNGMQVILAHSSEYPVVDVRLVIDGGTLHAPEHPQVPALADDLYLLRSRRAAAKVNLLHLSGGDLGRVIGPRTTTFRTQGLSIYVDFFIAGLAESYVYSVYAEGLLEVWKKKALALVDEAEVQQGLGLIQAYAEGLYGKGHPHAQTMGDIAVLRRSDVQRFRNAHYRAANSTVIVTGGFDRDIVLEHLEWSFTLPPDEWTSSWPRKRSPTEDIVIPEPTPAGGKLITRVVEDQRQTDILVGYPVRAALGPEQAGLAIITKMVELEVASVREVLGASYGISSVLHTDLPRIEVSGSIDSRRTAEAFEEIQAALARVGDESFEQRFHRAKRLVLRSLLESQSDPRRLGEQMAEAVSNGLAADYYTRLLPMWVTEMSSVGTRKLLGRVLSEDRAVTFVQGPQRGIDGVISAGSW